MIIEYNEIINLYKILCWEWKLSTEHKIHNEIFAKKNFGDMVGNIILNITEDNFRGTVILTVIDTAFV